MLAQPLMFPEASDTWNLSKANCQVKALFIVMAISKAIQSIAANETLKYFKHIRIYKYVY